MVAKNNLSELFFFIKRGAFFPPFVFYLMRPEDALFFVTQNNIARRKIIFCIQFPFKNMSIEKKIKETQHWHDVTLCALVRLLRFLR